MIGGVFKFFGLSLGTLLGLVILLVAGVAVYGSASTVARDGRSLAQQDDATRAMFAAAYGADAATRWKDEHDAGLPAVLPTATPAAYVPPTYVAPPPNYAATQTALQRQQVNATQTQTALQQQQRLDDQMNQWRNGQRQVCLATHPQTPYLC